MAARNFIIDLSRVPAPLPGARVPGAGGRDFEVCLRKAGAPALSSFMTCRDLLKQRLTERLENLFEELTGLRLHVLWHQPFDFDKSGQTLKLCPALQCKCGSGRPVPNECLACLNSTWRLDAPVEDGGCRVVGPCGLTSFRLGFPADGASSPLTLALQACVKEGNPVRRAGVSAATFERAVSLLRLIHHDLVVTLRASVAEAALDKMQHQMTVMATENTRLRQPLPGHSKSPDALMQPASDTGAPPIVREMVAYVQQHYHRPLSLGEVAAALKMNASYLCDLFSRHLGVTFRQYVVEVRMARARELLRDPRRRVCEVACAVGYASADQFRHAFKAHAGVPPSAWG